jgi:hypothetical protein
MNKRKKGNDSFFEAFIFHKNIGNVTKLFDKPVYSDKGRLDKSVGG